MRATFPILKIKEILKCLRELEIGLSKDEIKNPTGKKMMEVWEGFLTHMMGISKEDVRQPIFEAMDVFEFPELHEDSVAEFTMHFFLLRLMRAVGLTNVTMRDLLNPKPKKVIKILSALINFAKFREDKMSIYQERCKEIEEVQALHEQVSVDNDSLKSNLASLREQREQDAPTISRLEEETGQLSDQVLGLNKKHAALRAEIRTKKAAVKDLADKISTSKFELLNVKEENQELKGQIAKSPERQKKALVDMTTSINVKKEEVTVEEDKLKALQNKIGLLEKAKKKFQKRIGKIEVLGQLMKESRKLQKEIKEGATKLEKDKENANAAVMTADHIQGQIDEIKGKLNELHSQWDEKRANANKLVNEAMKKRMEVMHASAQEKAQVEHNQMLFKTRKHEMDLAKKAHSQKMQQWKLSYSELLKTVRRYHEYMREKILMNAN